jgi:hypothetical protein
MPTASDTSAPVAANASNAWVVEESGDRLTAKQVGAHQRPGRAVEESDDRGDDGSGARLSST